MASLFHPELLRQRLGGAATARDDGAGGASAAAASQPQPQQQQQPQRPRRVLAVQELLDTRFPLVRGLYSGYLGWDVLDDRRNALDARTAGAPPGSAAAAAAAAAAPSVVYPCVAPPLHPYLWQLAQAAVLGVAPLPLEQRTRIVYCGRTGVGKTENSGRRTLNEAALVRALRGAAAARGLTLDMFDSNAFPADDPQPLLDYWAGARVIIGPHGGALTNVVLAGCGTVVIELFPLAFGIKPPVGHAGMMMFMQSAFLEQSYYMLPVFSPYANGDFDAPVEDVLAIIDTELPLQLQA